MTTYTAETSTTEYITDPIDFTDGEPIDIDTILALLVSAGATEITDAGFEPHTLLSYTIEGETEYLRLTEVAA